MQKNVGAYGLTMSAEHKVIHIFTGTGPVAAIRVPAKYWGAILRYGETEKELSGGEAANHHQPDGNDGGDRGAGSPEAAIAREASYRQSVCEEWHHPVDHNWKRSGWKTADKKPVKMSSSGSA